ncbi:hypothetical protein BJX66DRAFT_265582 [Aspergillus keveii]|uniref:Uncharacterized protein n=1 Tax=Aspergillus keveii TaxID=714993 RepID=A0ABR4FYR7_9EURO
MNNFQDYYYTILYYITESLAYYQLEALSINPLTTNTKMLLHTLTLLTLSSMALAAPIPSQYRHTHTHTARQLPVGDLKLLNMIVPGSGIPESVGRLSGDLGGRKHL